MNTTELNRLNDVLKWEHDSLFSREKITLLSGEDLPVGAVCGKITKVTPTTGTADGGNTGNGTCTSVTGGEDTQIGTYTLECITAATDAGTFKVTTPDGDALPDATVAVAYTNDQLNFTLNDGATDFIVGDKFTIAVTAGSGKLVKIGYTAVDGSQNAYGLLIDDYDASSADLAVVAVVRGALIVASGLRWPVSFTSGGTYEVKVGDTITGATSAKTARVVKVILTGGTWAGADAAGILIVDEISGDFQAENIDVGSNTNVATVAVTKTADALAALKVAGIVTREEA